MIKTKSILAKWRAASISTLKNASVAYLVEKTFMKPSKLPTKVKIALAVAH